MSDSNNDNFRNPYAEDPENHDTIASLVRGAHRTHRRTSGKPEGERDKRYPSQINRKERRISFDLDPETKDELRALAAEIANSRQLSAVTQALLEYALEAHRTGRIKLEPKLGSRGISFEAVEA